MPPTVKRRPLTKNTAEGKQPEEVVKAVRSKSKVSKRSKKSNPNEDEPEEVTSEVKKPRKRFGLKK